MLVNDHVDVSRYFYMVVKVVSIDVSKKLLQEVCSLVKLVAKKLQPRQRSCQKVAALSKYFAKKLQPCQRSCQ